MAKALLIKQLKSTAQVPSTQREILKGIGLRGIGSSIYRADTRALRGMCNAVQHLICVEQVETSKSKRPVKAQGQNKGYKIA